MGSQEVYDRIRSEKANPQADVWFGGPNTIFARGARDGLLAPYRPSWAGAIPAESRAARRPLLRPLPHARRHRLQLGRHRRRRGAARLGRHPRAALCKDKILIRDPLASGTMRAIFGMILLRSLRRDRQAPTAASPGSPRLDAQTKEYVVNATLLLEKIGRREGLVTLWDLPDVLLEQAAGPPDRERLPAVGHAGHRRRGRPRRRREARRGGARAHRVAGLGRGAAPGGRAGLPAAGAHATSRAAELPAWARDVESRLVAAPRWTGTCSSARAPAGWRPGTGPCAAAPGNEEGLRVPGGATAFAPIIPSRPWPMT